MGVYDQAQSQRIAQRTGVEQPGIRLVYMEDLPEIAYRGQLIYNGTTDFIMVYDGDAWQTVGDNSANRLFVQAADPIIEENVAEGDQWYSTITGLLVVWNGSAWVEPEIPEDAIGEEQIAEEAITSKHTIQGARVIGTNIYTADPDVEDQYMQIVQDANGGNIFFHYGIGETFQGFMNPKAEGSRPAVKMSSGNMSASAGGSAQMTLFGAYSGGAGKKAEFNCDIYMGGDLVSTSSRRYKEEIEDLRWTTDQILALRPVSYRRKDTGVKSIGFIAEDADELDMDELVIKEDGQVEAFNYPAYTAALQLVCQRQQDQINELLARVESLEARFVTY